MNGQTAGYGPTGNLQTLGARSYGYDVLGQLKTVREGGALLATYGYDAAGSRAKITDTAGPRPSLVRHLIRPDFEWDATRALAKVHLDLGGTRVATATDAYTPPSGSGVAPGAPLAPRWILILGGAPTAAAALLLLLQLADRRRQRLPLARPALAGTVVVALFTSWAQPALASLPDGDLNADGRLDAADVLLAQRMASGTLAYDNEDLAHGDVAPLASGDAQLSVRDVVVLLRGIRGEDVDGDGVALATELAQGTSAFRADSDGDGWSDDAELAAGTDPVAADTDDDGFPDPGDASPRDGVLSRPRRSPGQRHARDAQRRRRRLPHRV